jgi:ankyrin repeat protein
MTFLAKIKDKFKAALSPQDSAGAPPASSPPSPSEATMKMLEWFKDPGMDDLQGVFIKKFMVEGANINAKDEEDNTPLIYVATQEAFSAPIAKYLIELGADINASNKKGWTPLMYAVALDRPQMIDLFLKAGAKTTLANGDGKQAIDLSGPGARDAIMQAMSREAEEAAIKVTQLADKAVVLDQPVATMRRLRFKGSANQLTTA